MTTPTVNAFYSPQNNTINFPRVFCNRRSSTPGATSRSTTVARAMVIGHELTHGFDDQGRKFDGDGNLRDWVDGGRWRRVRQARRLRRQRILRVTAVDDVKLNGRLTLGENTADNGGLRIALMALQDTLRAKRRSWTASRLSSASSWDSPRFGARTRRRRKSARAPLRTRTPPAATASTARCRTRRSSRRRFRARRASRWSARTPAGCGEERKACSAPMNADNTKLLSAFIGVYSAANTHFRRRP